jgi:hypothetical protein
MLEVEAMGGEVAALSTHVEMRVPLAPFGPQAGSSVVLVTPDMPEAGV